MAIDTVGIFGSVALMPSGVEAVKLTCSEDMALVADRFVRSDHKGSSPGRCCLAAVAFYVRAAACGPVICSCSVFGIVYRLDGNYGSMVAERIEMDSAAAASAVMAGLTISQDNMLGM